MQNLSISCFFIHASSTENFTPINLCDNTGGSLLRIMSKFPAYILSGSEAILIFVEIIDFHPTKYEKIYEK